MHRLFHAAISKNLVYKTMKLRFLQKVGSIGADLISADLMFQWVGTTTENILFLASTEHACPTRLDEMGSCNRRQVDLSCPSLLFPFCKEGKPHLSELHFSYLSLSNPLLTTDCCLTSSLDAEELNWFQFKFPNNC